MRRIYYEEEQHLKNNRWLLVFMLASSMAAFLPIVRAGKKILLGSHNPEGLNLAIKKFKP